jgi:hypothetical protein
MYNKYEAECNLRLNYLLSKLRRDWQSISHVQLEIGTVNNIATQQKMDVRLPQSRYPKLEPGFKYPPVDDLYSGLPVCLMPVFMLHLEHLRFGLYDDQVVVEPQSSLDTTTFGWPLFLFLDLENLMEAGCLWSSTFTDHDS